MCEKARKKQDKQHQMGGEKKEETHLVDEKAQFPTQGANFFQLCLRGVPQLAELGIDERPIPILVEVCQGGKARGKKVDRRGEKRD